MEYTIRQFQLEELNMLKVVAECLQKNNIPVGVLGPVFYNTSNGLVEVPKIKTDLTENSFKVSSIITSSMLCTYKNIKQISLF